MSGVEVAGLVLGAFPVVVSALEAYRTAFLPLKSWWKFQRTFENFIDDVGTQRVLFDNNLEKLLSPFVDSDIQMGILLGDPFGPSWRAPKLDQKLEARLGPSLPFYKSIVCRMKDTLTDLQLLLGLQNGQAIHLWQERKLGHIEIELEFRRLKISFSKQKFHHVDTLSKRNNELSQLLQTSDELAPMRKQRRSAPNTQFLRQLQSHALSLHKVLEKAWGCSCQSTHTAHLRLERRIDQSPVTNENWRLLLPNVDNNANQDSTMEVEVVIKEPENIVQGIAAASPIVQNVLSQFKLDIQAQSLTAVMSQTTLSVNAVANSVSTSMSGSSTLHPVRQKAQKKVSFSGSTTDAGSRPTSPNTITTMVSVPLTPIDDMCEALRSLGPSTTCLGFLQDQQKRQHIFVPTQTDSVLPNLTLESALKPGPDQTTLKTMNRRDRFTIAATLASSLLQLHTTPWMTEKWNKTNVVLHSDVSQQYIVPEPMLRAYFNGNASQASSQQDASMNTRFNTKRALSGLGIMLLELCFGKTIEDHPARPNFFGPNNQPNAFTDISTAREWHEDVLGELGDDMSDAVRRCLDCSFAPKPNFEDKDFQEAVFDGVIIPLQELLKIWERP